MSTAATGGLRERNRARRVQRILEATRELLREAPHESPGVERIAQRAEVAPATVFNLIGPRERIWAALADAMLAELDDRVPAAGDADPHTRARAIVSAIVDMICADPAVHRHVLAHWPQSARLLREDPASQLRNCLRAAADRGSIRADLDLRRLVGTITTACGGAAQLWGAGLIGDRALRDRCRTAVDVVFAAAGDREAADLLV